MLARIQVCLVAVLIVFSLPVFAGEADVIEADVRASGRGNYSFSVTVVHADTGWDHYADKWEVLAEDGTILGTRILSHPHVNEQPFTRSLSGAVVPEQIRTVTVRAHDSVHEYGGRTVPVVLP